MREAPVIMQVRRRLVELACPPELLKRKMRELAEHREDLKHEALEDGLSQSEAEARANELLGEPYALAEYLAAALRQSSWWGRHPILGFCVLPPLAILAAVLLLLILFFWSAPVVFPLHLASELASDPSGAVFIQSIWQVSYCVTIVLVASLFGRLSRRAVGGTKWGVMACAACALNGWMLYLQFRPHSLSVGYAPNPQWPAILTPLAVAALICWRQWRTNAKFGARSAAWTQARRKFRATIKARRQQEEKLKLPKNAVTPTTAIASLAFIGVLSFACVGWRGYSSMVMRQEQLREKIWPAERAAVLKEIAARQSIKETRNETTIDLKAKITLALNASLGDGKDNTLAELASGIHILGGVPFDVQGRVQLWGRGLAESGRFFPERVKNIAVGRNCERVHVLHGSQFTSHDLAGKTVARLVLRYADGSLAEIAIKAGEHLLDWWGPIYRTDAPQESRGTSAPGTELAWSGSNPWIKERRPEDSLRLYKSTFFNPHPERRLDSVDYVSELTEAAPFIVGMTVE
jgi:hypothetical protein